LAERGSNIVVASGISETTDHQFKYRLLPLGITPRFVRGGDAGKLRGAIDKNTKAVFVESISVEGLVVSDIEVVASIAHENGVPLVV
jgi:O-acetylhomoserine (thiol)-lyase